MTITDFQWWSILRTEYEIIIAKGDSEMNFIKLLIFTFALTSLNVFAGIINSNSLISSIEFDFANGSAQGSNTTATSTSYNSGIGIEGYADLTTGELGSYAATGGDGVQIWVSMFDVVTFDANAEISFDFTFDGTLMASNPFTAFGESSLMIYDVTGLTNWLESNVFDFGGGFAADRVTPVAEAVQIAKLVTIFDIGETYSEIGGAGEYFDNAALADGNSHYLSNTLSGTLNAEAGKSYGIRMLTNSYAANGGVADFLNTSSLSFSNLNGANFQSASGVFLSANTTSIPEPISVYLFFSALSCLILFKKRSKYQS